MAFIAYVQANSDEHDMVRQRHLLVEYAQKEQISISGFIQAEFFSRRNEKESRIDKLRSKLDKGDILLVTELSRLGRNMLEILNIINELAESGIPIVFVKQPQLSTMGSHGELLLAIYGYFAETERKLISIRTRQGLAAAKAQGKQLGRPKGSRNKSRVLDPYKEQIKKYLQMDLNLASIMKIVNDQLENPITYNALKYFVHNDEELSRFWQTQRKKIQHPH